MDELHAQKLSTTNSHMKQKQTNTHSSTHTHINKHTSNYTQTHTKIYINTKYKDTHNKIILQLSNKHTLIHIKHTLSQSPIFFLLCITPSWCANFIPTTCSNECLCNYKQVKMKVYGIRFKIFTSMKLAKQLASN